LADDIKKDLNIEAELIESSGGVFEVMKDDELIFSKKALRRFPTTDEIIAKLQ